MGSVSRTRSRKNLSSSLSKRIANAAPVLSLVTVIVVTAVYYTAIRSHDVELSFDQLSAFERQVTTLGNRSIYVCSGGNAKDMIYSLHRYEWEKVASKIDFVAFVYDEVYRMRLNSAWVEAVAGLLRESKPNGYGVVLFSCGCIIPNVVFQRTEVRFGGYECMMLPGFVMSHEFVHFEELAAQRTPCRKRERITKSNWYEENSFKIEEARREHEELRVKLMIENGEYAM
ncbi:hypothetical protein BWQ96_06116 [Gracilariopsis chorda]|uniref:Uncharacterized protein n=1 Tax=Gracilariopsis chorda TaxID=448386 RepID=A0A2V3IQ15_9FLOR|nr:hypothetical protein BWQ96_06116 [Gracilariopsis chorda]|eukprot:PXF44143.1 hypothetical protein BWQ96_06116 [Gracilariopsis chorda]